MLRFVRENWQSVLGIVIAGCATFAITLAGYEYNKDYGSLQLDMAGVTLVLLLFAAVGIAAGFVSGRVRDAIGSWIASIVGVFVAHFAFYVVLFPWVAYPSEDGFEGDIVPIAVFLAAFIGGGHWLGTLTRAWLEEPEPGEEPKPVGEAKPAKPEPAEAEQAEPEPTGEPEPADELAAAGGREGDSDT